MRFLASIIIMMSATPAISSDFQRVEERDSFVSIVSDRNLTRLGIKLKVSRDGSISGKAFGRKVSGDWSWDRGYFCRDLFVNGDVLDENNCQTVEVNGNTLRFTSDMGQGDFADLRLK